MERIATFPPNGRKAGPVSDPAAAGASAFPILSLAYAGLAVASVLLALDPVLWLWRSWVSPAYGSLGYAYGLALAALVWWSLSSGAPTRPASLAPVLMLAMLAAGLRLAGQVLAINTVSALALAVDVYALVRLARLDARPRALSPLWMAGLFLFTLPIEVILQRVVGYPLQLMSAEVSCRLLGLFFSDLTCDGVRLKLMGSDVLVDLPCSGAAGLVLLLAVFTGLNAIYRPRFGTAVLAGLAVLALAVLGNALRISALAVGLAYGAPVMAEPWHSVIGLVTLALSLTPLFLIYRPKPAPLRAGWQVPTLPAPALLVAAAVSVLAAITIVSLKGKPVDVSGTVSQPALPEQLRGAWGEEQPLSAIEAQYFTQYGGQAAKVQYGALGLNIVSTRSPLRHLHAPEVCLRGLGYRVRFMGTRYDGVPTAVYQAEGPDGDLWHVAVTYFNEGEQAAPSIGTVVWMWLRGQGGTWSSLQRITPWHMAEAERAAWDGAALAALDFSNLSSEGINQ